MDPTFRERGIHRQETPASAGDPDVTRNRVAGTGTGKGRERNGRQGARGRGEAGCVMVLSKMVGGNGTHQGAAMNTFGDVLEAVARRGVLAMLRQLECGAQRYNDLLRATSMDGKQLSRALRQAMRANLVERYVDPRQMPVTVRYRLSE